MIQYGTTQFFDICIYCTLIIVNKVLYVGHCKLVLTKLMIDDQGFKTYLVPGENLINFI